jgi:hypothetical protein
VSSRYYFRAAVARQRRGLINKPQLVQRPRQRLKSRALFDGRSRRYFDNRPQLAVLIAQWLMATTTSAR